MASVQSAPNLPQGGAVIPANLNTTQINELWLVSAAEPRPGQTAFIAPCTPQDCIQIDANEMLRSSINLRLKESGKTIPNTSNVTAYSPPFKIKDDSCSAHRPVFSNNRHSKANNNTPIPMELMVCIVPVAMLLEHDLYKHQAMLQIPLPWPPHQPKLPQQRSQQDRAIKLRLRRKRVQLRAMGASAMIKCEPYKAKSWHSRCSAKTRLSLQAYNSSSSNRSKADNPLQWHRHLQQLVRSWTHPLPQNSKAMESR